MPAQPKPEKKLHNEEVRDVELENIIGNLLIAEYQVGKLQGRVAEKISYSDIKKPTNSTYMFRRNDKWYKVSLQVDEIQL